MLYIQYFPPIGLSLVPPATDSIYAIAVDGGVVMPALVSFLSAEVYVNSLGGGYILGGFFNITYSVIDASFWNTINPETITYSGINTDSWAEINREITKSDIENIYGLFTYDITRSSIDAINYNLVYPTTESVTYSEIDSTSYNNAYPATTGITYSQIDYVYGDLALDITYSAIDDSFWSTINPETITYSGINADSWAEINREITKSDIENIYGLFTYDITRSNIEATNYNLIYPTTESVTYSEIDSTGYDDVYPAINAITQSTINTEEYLTIL